MKTIMAMTLCIFLSCCNKLFKSKDDFLTIPKTPYTGIQLRMDGYYYEKWDGKIYSISFFYKDGVFLDIGGRQEESDVRNYISKVSERNLPKGFGVLFFQRMKNL